MHVLFVSNCTKKAINRTNAVLDRYAIRRSSTTWATPITKDGLAEVHSALRSVATRQTSVACFVNKGTRDMTLLWTVGNSNMFSEKGEFAVATTTAKKINPPAYWIRVASLLAKVGGLAHDIAKATIHFQEKLLINYPIKCKIRHEWLSMQLLKLLRDHLNWSWDKAWTTLRENVNLRDKLVLSDANWTYKDAVDFIVGTHHRLFKGGNIDNPGSKDHVYPEIKSNGIINAETTICSPAGSPDLSVLKSTLDRLSKLGQGKGDLFWKATGIISRAAVIMADHSVSALQVATAKNKDDLYANTRDKDSTVLNQTLNWHLAEVAKQAQYNVTLFDKDDLPSLSPKTIEGIMDVVENTPEKKRFLWQNTGSDFLQAAPDTPTLVFSLAGTGSGKTRMNPKILAALAGDKPLRMAAVFNQRSLTLQTHTSFRNELGMAENEVACVIGDRLTELLHHQVTDEDPEDDGQDKVYEVTDCPDIVIPAWLQAICKTKPEMESLIGAPVLVSTIDYIINAGNPGAQGHHAHALLRVSNSDLILDEIGGYDTNALVAVLRLITMAAMFGRNIVASSATVSEHVALAVFEAFKTGLDMRAALYDKTFIPYVSFIDNATPPTGFSTSDNSIFSAQYRKKLDEIVALLRKNEIYRKPYWNPSNPPVGGRVTSSYAQISSTVKVITQWLHFYNRWHYGNDPDMRISFGIVRVANTRTAIEISDYLSKNDIAGNQVDRSKDSKIYVCSYHSSDFWMRRAYKELVLDKILKRSKGNNEILNNPEVALLVKRAKDQGYRDVLFIVTATPIEEIGRDHDFDWGIAEPSTAQSLIQLFGRVNRHRLVVASKPNVAVLQFNRRELEGSETFVFKWPGYEVRGKAYASHDAYKLLCIWGNGEPKVETRPQSITAEIMYGYTDGKCQFSIEDDKRIKDVLEKAKYESDFSNKGWMGSNLYLKYPLREHSDKQRWHYHEKGYFEQQQYTANGYEWIKKEPVGIISRRSDGVWLCPSIKDVLETGCDQIGNKYRDKWLEFEVTGNIDKKMLFDLDFGAHLVTSSPP